MNHISNAKHSHDVQLFRQIIAGKGDMQDASEKLCEMEAIFQKYKEHIQSLSAVVAAYEHARMETKNKIKSALAHKKKD